MSAVRNYLLAVTVTALLGSIVSALLPEGSIRRTASLTASLLLTLSVLTPLVQLDEPDLARSIQRVFLEQETARTGVEVKNRQLQQRIIKQSCEEYILDKAASLGLDAAVSVTVSDDGAGPYPSLVELTAVPTGEQMAAMQAFLRAELAVGPERQVWKTP